MNIYDYHQEAPLVKNKRCMIPRKTVDQERGETIFDHWEAPQLLISGK